MHRFEWPLIIGGNIYAYFCTINFTPDALAAWVGSVAASIVAICAGVSTIRSKHANRKAAEAQERAAEAKEREANARAYAEVAKATRQRLLTCLACKRNPIQNCAFQIDHSPEWCHRFKKK